MFCGNCGNKIDQNSKFCGFCGKPINRIENIHNNENTVNNDSYENTNLSNAAYSDKEIKKFADTIINNCKTIKKIKEDIIPWKTILASIVIFICGLIIFFIGKEQDGSTIVSSRYIEIVRDESFSIMLGKVLMWIGAIIFIIVIGWILYDYFKLNKLNSENFNYFNIIESEANNDSIEAKFELGFMYRHGYVVNEDYEKAFNLFNETLEENYAKSYYQLGFMYEYGYGTSINLKKALECYIKANKYIDKDRVYIIAYTKVGKFYWEGKAGLQVNYSLALDNFKKAVKYENSNSAEAFYYLGLAYLNGYGCGIDKSEAQKNFDKAYSYGFDKAKEMFFDLNNGKG